MEQNRPKQTDQQATNAALAALAAAGNAFALGQLWEVNKGFVRRQLWQWYEKNQTVARHWLERMEPLWQHSGAHR